MLNIPSTQGQNLIILAKGQTLDKNELEDIIKNTIKPWENHTQIRCNPNSENRGRPVTLKKILITTFMLLTAIVCTTDFG